MAPDYGTVRIDISFRNIRITEDDCKEEEKQPQREQPKKKSSKRKDERKQKDKTKSQVPLAIRRSAKPEETPETEDIAEARREFNRRPLTECRTLRRKVL